MPERLEQYLTQIGEQIRWKRARSILLRELENHALEQLDTCLETGLSQEEAETETLRQLGDPVKIGQDLDRLHQPKPQWRLLLLTGILVLMGTILQIVLLRGTGQIDPAKLILFAALGFGALTAGYFSNHLLLIRHSKMIYCGAIVLAVILMWTTPRINHASYYTHYVTMLYPAVFALLLCRLRGKGWTGMALSILAIFPLSVVILLAPRLLDLMVLLISGGVLLLTAAWKDWFCIGCKKGMMCTVGTLFTGGSTLLWIGNKAVATRLYEVLHPEQDPLGHGYMAMTIRSALEDTQLWGAGELSGQLAGLDYWSVMPEGANDAFLVTVIHMLGWIPFFLLSGILTALLLWVMIKILHQKNMAAKFLAMSILTIFMIHMFMSLMLTFGYVVLGAFCPFLKMSAETVLDMGLMGILLSVFRQESLPYDGVFQKPQRPKGRWKLVYVATEECADYTYKSLL